MPESFKYKVVHSSPEIDTVWKYINTPDLPAYNYRDDINRFLSVVGDNGWTNRQRIESTFSPEEKSLIGAEGNRLPIKVGTVLYLEYEKVNQVSFLTEGIEVVSTDDVAFKAAQLARLESDKGYVSVNKPIKSQLQVGSSKDIFPNVTVWIWCRSISSKTDKDGELQGEFFDLTPYIQTLTTNMGKNGGNFQVRLPSLICKLDGDMKWVFDTDTIKKYNSGKEYIAIGHSHKLGNEGLVRSQFLFNNIVTTNDLVFIRFETLKSETDRYTDDSRDYIDKSVLPNKIYDMIGLVDGTTMSTTPETNEVSINIAGRDLSKLFIDDGTYFYALENSKGIVRVAGSTTLKNSLLSRVVAEKGMKYIGLYNFTSIEYILKYIIQQLSNIKVVPNDLFSAYKDRRNKRFNEINFEPLEQRGTNYTPQFQEEVANGIWQIVKLVIDKSVSQRRLADTSFSTAQGSLLNFIQSAIHEPLCEFYMDTYGDQYHLIARKPPYDQKSVISLIEGKINTEDGELAESPAIIDIEEDDVLNETLMMDDSQVYSWYHFFPKGAMINSSVDYSTSILPAIFFDEYAQVFGSKPFQQSHAYVPYVPKSFDSQFGNLLYEQAFSDMKYVIESNQYLPFTRKGTISINRDRRVKIGNYIRYKPTGEIFYVNGVQQNFQISDSTIDATTTINVSRGMIEQLIYGVHLVPENGDSSNRIFVSYFNLIDTRLNIKYKEIRTPVVKQRKVGTKTIPGFQPTNITSDQVKEYAKLHSDGSYGQNIFSPLVKPTKITAEELSKLIKVKGPDAVFKWDSDLRKQKSYIDQLYEIQKEKERNSVPKSRFFYTNVSDAEIENPSMVTGSAYLDKYDPYPENKKRFIALVNSINKRGYNVILVAGSTNRSYAEQAALKKANDNNARAGHSTHEFGKGIDITIVNPKTGKVCSKRTSEEEWRATGVPDMANDLGFRWAGNNDGTFGTKGTGRYYIDRVHFELVNNQGIPTRTEDIFEEYTEWITTKGIDESSVFQNFKVNNYTFNFFLKKLQFNPEYQQVKSRQVYNSDQEGSRTDGRKFGDQTLENVIIKSSIKNRK